MKIAVVGATGLTGRQVVEALRVAGAETVAVSRRTGVDVTTGAGLDEALAGVNRIVDVTTERRKRSRQRRFRRGRRTVAWLEAGERIPVSQ